MLLIVKYEYGGGRKCGQSTRSERMIKDGKRRLSGRGVEEAIEHTRYENGRKMIGAEGCTPGMQE